MQARIGEKKAPRKLPTHVYENKKGQFYVMRKVQLEGASARWVADYMISFCWQSCCGERVGSHINIVKSQGRSTLGDMNFDNAVFNTFNMPPLHHIDYGAGVRAWKKEGTQRGWAR